jgi:hypothetical protein
MHRIVRSLKVDYIPLDIRQLRRVRLASTKRQPLLARDATAHRPNGLLLLKPKGIDPLELELNILVSLRNRNKARLGIEAGAVIPGLFGRHRSDGM